MNAKAAFQTDKRQSSHYRPYIQNDATQSQEQTLEIFAETQTSAHQFSSSNLFINEQKKRHKKEEKREKKRTSESKELRQKNKPLDRQLSTC